MQHAGGGGGGARRPVPSGDTEPGEHIHIYTSLNSTQLHRLIGV